MRSKIILVCSAMAVLPAIAYAATSLNHTFFIPDNPFYSMSGFDLGGHIYDDDNTVLISGGTGVENFCYVDTPSSSGVLTFGFHFDGYGSNHYGSETPGSDFDDRDPSWNFSGADHYEDDLTMIREIGGQYALWDTANFPCEFWYTDQYTIGNPQTVWSFPASASNRRYF